MPKFLNDAKFWRAFALVNILAYIVLWVVAEFTGWVNDPAFISRVSMIALILSSLAWWASERVGVRQEQDADVQEVIDKMDE